MKVGYNYSYHASRRNIIGQVDDVDYVRVYDINNMLNYFEKISRKLTGHSLYDPHNQRFSFNDLNLNKVDILHFFNTISFSRTPWISSFETVIPRYQSILSCHHGRNCGYSELTQDRRILKAIAALYSGSCRKIIALSKCNLNMQKDFLQHFPDFSTEIENKLIQMHPPQEILTDKRHDKRISRNEKIHFMFVGRAFFRKGGMEILEAFQDAKKNAFCNLQLTIISNLARDDAAAGETERDEKSARDIIHRNSDWIAHYNYLPNRDVLELMKTAHVGLLPTYADTYGYTVLEFQACGCPVISTNIRALPEINSNEMGWLIEIPQNRLGEALFTTQEDRNKIRLIIKEKLRSIIAEIMEYRESIAQKSLLAQQHIKDEHSPEQYSRRLGQIYRDALL
ncbi:MAG: glycosyltransferase family 4 protein [Candidatus Cloacimonetes bacterium]|nr:glycosyltransferase family 4 protein [Candidatus Cloacimonadota bacterium]